MSNVFDSPEYYSQGPGPGGQARNPFDSPDMVMQPGREIAKPDASLWSSIPRGYYGTLGGVDALKYSLGAMDNASFAKSIFENEQLIQANPKTQAELDLERDYSIPGLLRNPMAIPGILGESLAPLAAIALTSGAGGAVGGFPGAVAGMGASGAFTTYGQAFKDYLKRNGVDFKSQIGVELALEDPDLVREAILYAAGQSGVSGILNAAGGYLGGKVAQRFFVPGATRKEILTGGAQEIGIGAGTGAATDIASAVVGGRPVDLGSAGVSGVVGGALAAPFAIPGFFGRRGASVDNTPPKPEDLAKAGEVAAQKPKEVPKKEEGRPIVTVGKVEAAMPPPDTGPIVGDETGASFPKPKPPAPKAEEPPVDTMPPGPRINAGPKVQGVRTSLDIARDMRTTVESVWALHGPSINRGVISMDEAWVKEASLAQRFKVLQQQYMEAVKAEAEPDPWVATDGSDASQVWDTPKFMNWFGNSVVRDDGGFPQAVYHSSIRPNMPPVMHSGMHFGTMEAAQQRLNETAKLFDEARHLGWPKQGQQALTMTPVYLKAEKPFRTQDLGEWKPQDWYKELRRHADKFTDQELAQIADGRLEPFDLLKKYGYDSIVYKNFYEDPGKDSWIIFDPQQVKSAIGNRGSFDPMDPNILYSERVNEGPPLKSGEIRVDARSASATFGVGEEWKALLPAVERSLKALNAMSEYFGTKGIKVYFGRAEAHEILPDGSIRRNYGRMVEIPNGYAVRISLAEHMNAEQVHSTIMHEFGHIVLKEPFRAAKPTTQRAIQEFHKNFMDRIAQMDVPSAFLLRSSPILSSMSPAIENWKGVPAHMHPKAAYYWSFDEWFAEGVVKWSQTSEKALNVVDKFFASLGRSLRNFVKEYSKKVGIDFWKKDVLNEWLDSFMPAVHLITAKDFMTQYAKERAETAKAIGGGADGTPKGPQGDGIRGIGGELFGEDMPEGLKQGAAGVDRFNWLYKYALGIPQVAARNRHVRSLQLYNETNQVMHREIVQMMTLAGDTLKSWRNLGQVHSHRVSLLIDDYMNMRYRTQDEIDNGVARLPTQAELTQMVADNKVSAQGLEVFNQIVKDFYRMLDETQKRLEDRANAMLDPVASAFRLQQIAKEFAAMRSRPYFPAMRFGEFTLTIRDVEKRVVHFEQFPTKAMRDAAAKEAARTFYAPHLGFEIFKSKMPVEVLPFVGMPPGLLSMIGESLNLSKSQRQMMDELKFDLAPEHSFKHRFQRKRLVSGYSKDFMRAYGNYMFHGANYLGRAKYADQLRQYVADTRESQHFMPSGDKRMDIANYMEEHLANNVLDTKADFVKLKSVIFHFALGFSPAAAAINLTQTLVGTAPYLSAKFGTFKALSAMMRAGADLHTYYKEGKLNNMTAEDLKALSQAVKDGIVTEAQAAALAAIGEGRNLGKRFGSTFERTWEHLTTASAFMFQMTEQMNRRIAFRAAYRLARANVNAPHVLQTLRANELMYQKLRAEGWTHESAASYVTAKDAVESTQFIYASYARPRIFRGKLGSVFMFKAFLQNTLFMLWNYPDVAVRSVLVMAALGGMMAIPGMEDVRDMAKMLGHRLFGAFFDVEHEARKLVMELSNGTIEPDIVLHGGARRGFGIPAVLNMLGINAPEFDMSRSMGIGAINPVPLNPLFGAVDDPEQAIAQAGQRASGAAFGTFFNFYKAAFDAQLDARDFKRWERIYPRWLAAVNRSIRVGVEGSERTSGGAEIVPFDSDNPTHTAELIGAAMGFQPTRLTGEWDLIRAKAEVVMYWDLKRQDLLRQFDWARQQEDPESINRVLQAIQNFNTSLPPMFGQKAIKGDDIKASVRNRERSRAMVEGGLTPQRQNIGIGMEVDQLYPEVLRQRVK